MLNDLLPSKKSSSSLILLIINQLLILPIIPLLLISNLSSIHALKNDHDKRMLIRASILSTTAQPTAQRSSNNVNNDVQNDPQNPTNIIIDPTISPSTTSITTRELSSTNDEIQRLTLTVPTTTANTNGNRSSSTSSNRSTSTSIPSSLTSENSQDQEVFKMLFTIGSDDSYYNGRFQFGANSQRDNNSNNQNFQNIGLRLDLTQPNIWVMNQQNFNPCSEIYQWVSSYASEYSTFSSLPASLTTASFYTDNCAKRGMYTSSTLNQPQPSDVSVSNGDNYLIPYMNQIRAFGQFVTDDFNFNITNGYNYQMSNFTFLDANDTNMFVGGLGLAGHPKGTGFLSRLVEGNIIKSESYSLWFNNDTYNNNSLAQLIPGIVNKKYYIGNLYSFDMLPHQGIRFNADEQQANQDLSELILPIINLDDIKVERLDTGQSLSIKSTNNALPVLLDSRIVFSYLPIDILVNLAIQTNAYYSSEASRWVVSCDLLSSGNATLDFQIGSDLEIKVPFKDLIVDAIYQGNTLHFEDGSKACYLTVLPTDNAGFNSLGLPFLKNIYLVVDNDYRKIAIANSNKYLTIDEDDYLNKLSRNKLEIIKDDDSYNSTNQTSTSGNNSIAYIESGTIPFATPMTYDSGNATLSYSQISQQSGNSVVLDIPARLSGAIIRSGSIYLSGNQMVTGSNSTNSDSLLNNLGSSTSSGLANSLNFNSPNFSKTNQQLYNYFIIFIVLGIGLILL